MSHKARLERLEKESGQDPELIYQIDYVRDWDGERKDVAETRYIRPGHGWIDFDDIRWET